MEESAEARINYGAQVHQNDGNITNNFYSSDEEIKDLLREIVEINKEKTKRKTRRKHRKSETRSPSPLPGPPPEVPGPEPPQISWPSTADFLAFYQYDPALIPSDTYALTHITQALDTDRLVTLVRNPQLRSLLLPAEDDTSPAALLVNGGAYSTPQSETAFFAARLVEALLSLQQDQSLSVPDASGSEEERSNIFTLSFFCGQHRDFRTDPSATPSELVMSLLLQLVAQHGALPTPTLQACMAELRPTDAGSVCASITRLVSCLETGTRVVIVLEGIEFFEDGPGETGMWTRGVVQTLVDLARESRGEGAGVDLRVLAMSPSRARFVEDVFAEEETVTLPRFCKPGAMLMGHGSLDFRE